MTQVDYSRSVNIRAYRCGGCGLAGVKLWRLRAVMVSEQTLRCVRCACREAGIDYRLVNGFGLHEEERTFEQAARVTLRIGNRVPAVPSDVSGGRILNYYAMGLMVVGTPQFEWWRALPL